MSVFAVVKALATEEEAALLAELEVRLADLKLNAEEHGESMVAEEGGDGPLCPVAAIRFLRARDMDLDKAE
eukprot:gene30640-16591_t